MIMLICIGIVIGLVVGVICFAVFISTIKIM